MASSNLLATQRGAQTIGDDYTIVVDYNGDGAPGRGWELRDGGIAGTIITAFTWDGAQTTTTFSGVSYVWPLADAAGQLESDGAGNLSWAAGSAITGTGTDNQVAVWSGTTTLDSSANFTFDAAAPLLSVSSDVDITLLSTENITIDGRTSERAITLGVMEFLHTPSISGTRCVRLDVDINSQPDTSAFVVEYIAKALAAGELGEVISVDVNTSTATGGAVHALHVTKAGSGTVDVWGMFAGAGVKPIQQSSGTLGSVEVALTTSDEVAFNDVTSSFNSSASDATLWAADDDFVYVGDAAKFGVLEFAWNTVASGAGIKPGLRAHLWFWLSEAKTSEELREWAKSVKGIDPAVYLDAVRAGRWNQRGAR